MGPCTAVDSRCRGTTVSCCVADPRRCLPTTSVTGVQQSTRLWLCVVTVLESHIANAGCRVCHAAGSQ